MKAPSTRESTFLDAVQRVLAAGEILVVVRYVYCAGNRDYLILKSMTEFQDLLGRLRERDSVVVMKSFQKIIEGVVDGTLIEAATAAFKEGSNWILIGKDNVGSSQDSAYSASVLELREALEDRLGNYVCVVGGPDFISEEASIAAYLPDDDGVVRPGAY